MERMKILLTALNAKYVHTALGLWNIYSFCREDFPELVFREYNINQELAWVFGEIYLESAAAVAFSCNIWNIEPILILCERLKRVAPATRIILGGPEVWDEPAAIMARHPAVDYIIVGEGEIAFREWLVQFHRTEPGWESVAGLIFRRGTEIVVNPPRPEIADLSVLPFPYPRDLEAFRRKLIYYETSRGCPYQCQYCLSANERSVRFFPMETVKRDLLRFIETGIAQVKFVDRTFNCDPERAKEIWRFLLDHPGETNFHFEIVGDRLDDESLRILSEAPAGLFQFEIGVQSVNPETLRLIKRKMDFERLSDRVRRLVGESRVFVHLDLIAGLPGEDYTSFARTVNETLALGPHRLQLGFLKLLHGSGLRAHAAEYGYEYTRETPYEILANHWISYPELLRLKTIEDLLERYYNSGRFARSCQFLFSGFETPFAALEALGDWWKRQGYDQFSHQTKELYSHLIRFYREWRGTGRETQYFRELLKFDLLRQERVIELPDWAGETEPGLRKIGYQFWQDPANRRRYLGEIAGLEIRDIQRRVVFARFECDPLADFVSQIPPEPKETIYLFVYDRKGARPFRVEISIRP
jgi:radical SAM superfamily enzyme YgiQ (UPF0313 family)